MAARPRACRSLAGWLAESPTAQADLQGLPAAPRGWPGGQRFRLRLFRRASRPVLSPQSDLVGGSGQVLYHWGPRGFCVPASLGVGGRRVRVLQLLLGPVQMTPATCGTTRRRTTTTRRTAWRASSCPIFLPRVNTVSVEASPVHAGTKSGAPRERPMGSCTP